MSIPYDKQGTPLSLSAEVERVFGIPEAAESIAAAWSVVERLRAEGLQIDICVREDNAGWWCELTRACEAKPYGYGCDESPCVAICLAALAWAERGKEKG
jgi:ABA sandwich protein